MTCVYKSITDTYILIYPYSTVFIFNPKFQINCTRFPSLEILRYYLGDIRLFKMTLTLNQSQARCVSRGKGIMDPESPLTRPSKSPQTSAPEGTL